jgi:mannose/cellobiose epimerase-like protein (N-acyl-D-glucosamine 2-epimerase family)
MQPRHEPLVTEMLKHAAEDARAWLFEHALPIWWERGYDRVTRSFHERLELDGGPTAPEPRRVRVQARQTVVYAFAGRMGWPGPWRDAVEAGADVLLRRALRPDGGTRHLLAPDGAPLDDRRDLYDAAFVLLALSEAAQVLDKRADLIDAATRLEGWIHWYWEHAEGGFEEGDVSPIPPRRQNPHMHLFEALLSFYETTGDALHLERAGALGRLFRDRLFDAEHGALPEYYDDAWRPMSDHLGRIVEPGHHFEWCWLLHRWRALGGEDLTAEAERLRAHAEAHGIESGAACDQNLIDGRPLKTTARLWPQTERLKANLARFEVARDEECARLALQANDMIRAFCGTPLPGYWYDLRTPDGAFTREPARASSFYHIMVALAELIRVADARP